MQSEQVLDIAKVWLGPDGIARVMHVPGVELRLADAKATMSAFLKVTQGKRCPLLVDTRGMRAVSRETRLYYAGAEAAQAASAVALLVDTPVSRVLGNFYVGLSNPHLPTRLFSSEPEALVWLQGYL